MISTYHKGNYNRTEKFLTQSRKLNISRILDRYGQEGVRALSAATPVDSGKTAKSWGYRVKVSNKSSTVIWTNSNVNDGVPIAILIQYGHGTMNGGYVQGRDYINPAVKTIFDNIANEIWREVLNL